MGLRCSGRNGDRETPPRLGARPWANLPAPQPGKWPRRKQRWSQKSCRQRRLNKTTTAWRRAFRTPLSADQYFGIVPNPQLAARVAHPCIGSTGRSTSAAAAEGRDPVFGAWWKRRKDIVAVARACQAILRGPRRPRGVKARWRDRARGIVWPPGGSAVSTGLSRTDPAGSPFPARVQSGSTWTQNPAFSLTCKRVRCY